MHAGPPADSDTLESALLALLGRQGRRMPLPVLAAALMICLLARDPPYDQDAALAGWLVAVAAVLALRMVVLGKLPAMHTVAIGRRLDIAVILSAVNGCTHALGLVAFPAHTDFKFAIQSMLLVGLCSGAVATTAGYRPVFVAYLAPVIGALVLGWAAHSQPVAVIIAVFGAVLLALAADSFRLFRESFEIRLQQVKLNARLRDALWQAEQANRAKTRFLAAASHDLRQPIHTVSLFAAALALRPLDPVTRDISRHIDEALQKLAGQLDALLDVSKLDAGVVPVHPAPFAVAAFMQRMEQQYAPQAAARSLALSFAMSGEASARTLAWSDENLLGRAVGNLIDNAIKYSHAGVVGLSLHAQGGRLVIGVEDSGPGIPLEEQARVFEEFYQLGNRERDRSNGLGLGLSIVQRLAALLPARLEMVSLPGCGTSFYLILPVYMGAPHSVQADQPASNALAGLTVLVVDDEAAVRQGMQALLQELGATVLLAEGASQALALVAHQRPDLLLADMRLRGSDDGIAVTRALRARLPLLPAVLLSGDTSPARLREASEAGIPLLHKPVPLAQLQSLVASFAIRPVPEHHHVH
jgi:signal transduction histidine kinase